MFRKIFISIAFSNKRMNDGRIGLMKNALLQLGLKSISYKLSGERTDLEKEYDDEYRKYGEAMKEVYPEYRGGPTLLNIPFLAEKPKGILEQYTNEIAPLPFERAYLFDMVNGIIILTKDGTEKSVVHYKEERDLMAGKLYLHNHVGNMSFSIKDLKFAMENGLAEMRAVNLSDGKIYRYTMMAAPEWNAEYYYGTVEPLYHEIGLQLMPTEYPAVLEGRITVERIQPVLPDAIMRELSERLGFQYSMNVYVP